MALGRPAKVWLIVLSVLALLLVGGIVTLKLLFSGERLKAFIIPPLEEATGRTVTLAEVSLSIFPTLAVQADSLTISNRPEEGFSSRPSCTVDRLFLDVNLWPLLSGNIEVPTLRIERPVVYLEVTADGRKNYSGGTTEAVEPAPGASPARMTGGALVLSDIAILDGSIEYVNRKRDSRTALEGIRLNTSVQIDTSAGTAAMTIDAAVGAISYGTVDNAMISGLPLVLTQRVVYHEIRDSVEFAEGSGTVGTIPVNVSGFIAHATTTPYIDFQMESTEANIADLFSLAPAEYMKDTEGLAGEGKAQVRIRMAGPVSDSTDAGVTGSVSSRNASVRYASLPKPITNITIVLDFTRIPTKQEFRITTLTANLGSNPISATLSVVDFDDPLMNAAVNASLNLAELKDYYPLDEGTELSGTMKADVKVSGKVNKPKTRKSSGSLDFRNVTIKTAGNANPIKNLNGSISFNDLTVQSRQLTMMIGSSDLDLGFTVSNYLGILADEKQAAPPSASLTLKSNRLRTADLTGEPSGSTGGKSRKTEGEKKGLPFPGVDMSVTATIGTLTMEKFELKNVRGAMRIRDGVITIENFSGSTYGGNIATKGTIDMTPPSPLFDLTMDMNGLDAHHMLPQFTSFGSRLYGDLTMSTRIKGALDDTLGLVPQSLAGDGTVKVVKGKVDGVAVNQSLASMLSLPDLSVINFNDWQNSFTIANGRLALRDLSIKSAKTEYGVNGSIGFDGSLDYALTLLLAPETADKIKLPGVAGYVGQAAELFKDESGRIRLDFSVTGTSDSPKLALKTDRAQKKAEDLVKQKLDAEKKKLEEELKKKAGDLLKDFDPFKKKDGP
ncbi:MAG: AsmA family protein [Ignavibacteria bacterium]|nr:AsmA family protein [Ignavibacteria bacterium]